MKTVGIRVDTIPGDEDGGPDSCEMFIECPECGKETVTYEGVYEGEEVLKLYCPNGHNFKAYVKLEATAELIQDE